jgi:transcriptional regulator with XRE-family HTH domain
MNERIKRFMDYKGLSPSELADGINVQRSNITHVLHGRNNPGFQFITKMLEAFPDINAKWLLTGEGEMIIKEEITNEKKQVNLFSQIVPPSVSIEHEEMSGSEKPRPVEKETARSAQPMTELLQSISPDDHKKIESIVIFYTDQTFRQYTTSK